jgi:hypothetical protein
MSKIYSKQIAKESFDITKLLRCRYYQLDSYVQMTASPATGPQALFPDPSHPSHPSPMDSGRLFYEFKCYHPGCDFQTKDLEEYERHGALKHLENPLLYPSRYEIQKYGLAPQGKEWEV